MRSRLPTAVLICLALIALPRADEPQAPPSLEHQVKIAFLFNFAKFVDWPDGVFKSPQSPLNLGLIGNDAFCREVEVALQGKVVNGRPLVVRRLHAADAGNGVEILFVSPAEPEPQRILAGLGAAPILTVGDAQEFAHQGGMINFRMEDNKVRFEINLEAARRTGLKISSRLLAVALVFHDDAPPGDGR